MSTMMSLQEAVNLVSGKQQQDVLFLRSILADRFPKTMQAIHLLDYEYSAVREYKGYNLVKRDSKKLGFVYYVRYWHDGKMLSSKWCTHTNDYEKACFFAEQNREMIIERYLKTSGGHAVLFFKKFYNSTNPIYKTECKRNGELSEVRRQRFMSIMNNKFIPFLKARRIVHLDVITVPVLDDFQDTLLEKGLTAHTVNETMTAISRAFKYLTRKGLVTINPCTDLLTVPDKLEEKKTHGCYELALLKGVFDKRWKDKLSYLLNLIIYTTDMRNSEIKRFCMNDIVTISGVHFIDIQKSKTKSGTRLVPLHDTVYQKIAAYAAGRGKNTPLFATMNSRHFRQAYEELAKMLNISEAFIEEHNITFYSGRHYWKTLMNAEGLGEDVEELFMGHKVTGNVKKLYNHHDMQGKKLLAKKAREIFRILDKRLFTRASGFSPCSTEIERTLKKPSKTIRKA